MTPSLRIVSLLPSATEIVCALGLADQLVAVTHECDHPPEVSGKPHVTTSVIDSNELTARQIDDAVRESLEEQSTIYHLDRDLLERLCPDLILTQELCTVCAVGTDLVREAAASLPSRPRIVSLEPTSLTEVLDSIETVGELTDTASRALALRARLEDRLDAVRAAVAGRPRPRTLTLEWVDPCFTGGHWVPEMVEMAGGVDVLGEAGKPSREQSWDTAIASEPDIVVAMPCGFGIDRSRRELDRAPLPGDWSSMPAVVHGRVYVVDGSSYFNRPGPRLVDGVEILATILHPEVFAQAPPGSFERYSSAPTSARAGQ